MGFFSNLFGKKKEKAVVEEAKNEPEVQQQETVAPEEVQEELPKGDKYSFDNYAKDFPELLDFARDTMNTYFLTLDVKYPEDWVWMQIYPQQVRFQHLCVAYKSHVLSILIALYQEKDGEAKLYYNNAEYDNLIHECAKYQLTPCIFPINVVDGQPAVEECYLIDARTFQPLDIENLPDDNGGMMSEWEIHNSGVMLTCNFLAQEGHKEMNYCDVIGVNPQVLFNNEGETSFVLVRSVPAGLKEQKFVISRKMLKNYENLKGYFMNVEWSVLEGGSVNDQCETLRRRAQLIPSQPALIELDEAISQFDFIEVDENN